MERINTSNAAEPVRLDRRSAVERAEIVYRDVALLRAKAAVLCLDEPRLDGVVMLIDSAMFGVKSHLDKLRRMGSGTESPASA